MKINEAIQVLKKELYSVQKQIELLEEKEQLLIQDIDKLEIENEKTE